MAISMTGFGSAELDYNGKILTCTVKSVNHRFLETQFRLPSSLAGMENELRAACRPFIQRGRYEINIRFQDTEAEEIRLALDLDLAKEYKNALEELASFLQRPLEVNLRDLASYPGVLRKELQKINEEEFRPLLLDLLKRAISAQKTMREEEGARLCLDINQRISTLEGLLEKVVARQPLVVEAYRERLSKRIEELFARKREAFYDEARLAAELLIFADKAAIDEETVRLSSHLQALRSTLLLQEAVGKKLDFIVQEINREINTIGSKANDLAITELVLEMKTENEKIREQIQNLE